MIPAARTARRRRRTPATRTVEILAVSPIDAPARDDAVADAAPGVHLRQRGLPSSRRVANRGRGEKPSIVVVALLGTLERLVPLAAALARAVSRLALAALAASIAIAAVVVARWLPDGAGERVAVALLLMLLFAPPGVLIAFYVVLRELVRLPERLRRYPDLSRQHAVELAELARGADDAGRPAWRRVPGRAWRLVALVRSARELLAPHAPVAPLASPAFLVATLVAAVASVLLVVAAVIVVLVALAT